MPEKRPRRSKVSISSHGTSSGETTSSTSMQTTSSSQSTSTGTHTTSSSQSTSTGTHSLHTHSTSSNQSSDALSSLSGEKPADSRQVQYSSSEVEQKMIRILNKVSDYYSDQDSYRSDPRIYEFIDVICGWESTVPCPIYVTSASSATPPVVKKRKSKVNCDLDFRRGSNKYDSDFDFPATLREAIVDENTYRYIPGNGRYRLCKDSRKLCSNVRVETNYTFMPKRPSLCTELRLLQRQANRDLRKEIQRKDDEILGEISDDDNVEGNMTDIVENVDGDPRKNAMAPSQVRIGQNFRKKRREKSQLAISTGEKEETTFLSKTFTDRIMKNFSSKISAMEEKIRCEANWWNMTTGGGSYLSTNKKSDRRASLPLDSIRVLPANAVLRPGNGLKPLEKPTVQEDYKPLAPKVYSSTTFTTPSNGDTPRYHLLDSFILNPLNLEGNNAVKSEAKRKGRVLKSKKCVKADEHDIEEINGFRSSALGQPNPRDKKVAELTDTDVVVQPTSGLPELFGKKLEVTVAAQKWM